MSDDKSKRGGRDRERIAMDEEYEVRYWTQAFGVSKDELQEAVKSVGNNADAVRRHLQDRSRK